eukprot:TRINITY_DN6486_c0_g1_i1.p1 TRINITY_DN6486_c0_g1~~TRINITY_DN6486_c0_g1_i1.p1  ORF type:complete len:1001 (-),score=165.56 TRINITY_DN6486_c0_g1_i1:175-3177(-)
MEAPLSVFLYNLCLAVQERPELDDVIVHGPHRDAVTLLDCSRALWHAVRCIHTDPLLPTKLLFASDACTTEFSYIDDAHAHHASNHTQNLNSKAQIAPISTSQTPPRVNPIIAKHTPQKSAQHAHAIHTDSPPVDLSAPLFGDPSTTLLLHPSTSTSTSATTSISAPSFTLTNQASINVPPTRVNPLLAYSASAQSFPHNQSEPLDPISLSTADVHSETLFDADDQSTITSISHSSLANSASSIYSSTSSLVTNLSSCSTTSSRSSSQSLFASPATATHTSNTLEGRASHFSNPILSDEYNYTPEYNYNYSYSHPNEYTRDRRRKSFRIGNLITRLVSGPRVRPEPHRLHPILSHLHAQQINSIPSDTTCTPEVDDHPAPSILRRRSRHLLCLPKLTTLPDEVLLLTFSFLPHHELITSVGHVNSRFHRLVRHHSLWTAFDLLTFATPFAGIHMPVSNTAFSWFIRRIAPRSWKPQSLSFAHAYDLSDEGLSQLLPLMTHTILIDLSNVRALSLLACRQLSPSIILALVSAMSNIRILDLGACRQISDAFLVDLARLPHLHSTLQVLDLGECGPTSSTTNEAANSPDGLSIQSPSLTLAPSALHMTLASTWASDGISDLGISHIATRFQHLQSVNLDNCRRLTDWGLTLLADGCPDLRVLGLRGCEQLTDIGITHLAIRCSNLQTLNLDGCRNLTDGAIIAIASHCMAIQNLLLGWCVQVTDHSLLALAGHSRMLQTLGLRGCRRLSDQGIYAVARKCKSLQSLDLNECSALNDTAVRALCKHGDSLQSIELGWCPNLTEKGLRSALNYIAVRIKEHLRTIKSVPGAASSIVSVFGEHLIIGLRALSLAWNPNVTDGVLSLIPKACPDLQALCLAGCHNISDPGVSNIARCHRLQYVDLANCGRVSDLQLARLIVACPDIGHLNLNRVLQVGARTLNSIAAHSLKLRHLDLSYCPLVEDGMLAPILHNCTLLRNLNLEGCVLVSMDTVQRIRDLGIQVSF